VAGLVIGSHICAASETIQAMRPHSTVQRGLRPPGLGGLRSGERSQLMLGLPRDRVHPEMMTHQVHRADAPVDKAILPLERSI
jgi:hypothetical protein